MLKGTEVVANDVHLEDEARALVVSGPNAGGKTVTLTAVGLCALMLRAGLPIPADAGSRMPLFRSVHSRWAMRRTCQPGPVDLQRPRRRAARHRAPAGKGSLVLIDEIAADTDPREGAAIAIAVLEDLLSKGAVVLVTTHLEELKALAHLDPRFVNARVGFDAQEDGAHLPAAAGRGGRLVGDRDGARGWGCPSASARGRATWR